MTQLLPKQMYVENVVTVMKRELLDECDYIREAECNQKFSQLLKDGNACFKKSLMINIWKLYQFSTKNNKIRQSVSSA